MSTRKFPHMLAHREDLGAFGSCPTSRAAKQIENFFSRTLDKLFKFRYSSRPALQNAAVAQLDRVSGYEPEGRGFESCQPRHFSTGRKLVSKEIGLFLLPAKFFPFSSPPSSYEVIHRFSRGFFSKFSICTFLHQLGFSLVREGICRASELRCLSYPQILWINRRTTCPPRLWTTFFLRLKPLLGRRIADSKRPRPGYPPKARPRCFPQLASLCEVFARELLEADSEVPFFVGR